MPYHQSLRLENFTAFSEAEFEFVPGINVFIGENGTGKTNLLKILFGVQLAHEKHQAAIEDQEIPRSPNFDSLFQTEFAKFLTRIGKEKFSIRGDFGDNHWGYTVYSYLNGSSEINSKAGYAPMSRPVFIPTCDVISHTKGFISLYSLYSIDFDYTYYDLTIKLLSSERRDADEQYISIQKALGDVIGGEISIESERFYLSTPNGKLPMPLVAEGLRKIATLQQLIRNGLLQPGSTLFWDEPEANLSPIVRDDLVQALLLLARSGVQIFLATHSYIILKELDLRKEEGDTVRFFALEKHPDGTKVHSSDDYAQLEPNKIAEQFDSIYDRELTRATGRKRAI